MVYATALRNHDREGVDARLIPIAGACDSVVTR